MIRRNALPLIFGLVLVVMGAVFLAINLGKLEIRLDVRVLRFLLPALFLALGLPRLIRHFVWDEERLREHPGKAGLLSGLFWTFAGVVLLLHFLGSLGGLTFFGSYWPIVLILFGLGKILDTYRLKEKLPLRAAEIVGAVFIVVLGLLSSRLAEAHLPLIDISIPAALSRRGVSIEELSGSSFSWTEERVLSVEDVSALELRNLYGSVKVETGLAERVEIRLEKVVFQKAREEAQKASDEIRLTHRVQDETLHLGTNREALAGRDLKFNTHFLVRVPENWKVRVVNAHGEVTVTGLKGGCHVENAYGNVAAHDLTGDLSVKNRYRGITVRNLVGNASVENQRGSVSIRDVTGSVEARNEYASLTVEGVQGRLEVANRSGSVRADKISGGARILAPGSSVRVSNVSEGVTIENSHRGVNLSHLGAGLTLDTSYNRVDLSDVHGPVTIRAAHSDIRGQRFGSGVTIQARGSAVSLTDVPGALNVNTSLRRVALSQFLGSVEVQNEFGEITLTSKGPLAGPISASNRNGDITLTVPANVSFKLSATAKGGRVVSEFWEDSAEAVQVLEKSLGAGQPEVLLQTTYSQIRIRKG